MFNFVLYSLMILAAAGMLYGNNKFKSKGVAWGRPLAGACGVLALICALVIMWQFMTKDQKRIGGIIEKELRYFDYKMQYLANYLSTKYPSHKYLLITNQKTEYNAQRHDVMLAALKSLTIAKVHEVLPPEEMGPEAMGGAEMFLTADKFDQIIEDNPECTMVISTLGLPMDYQRMKFWRKKAAERPQLVLVDAYVWDLKKAIQVGAIAAVVQYKPDAEYKPNEDVPDNVDEAFTKRFILLTPENVEEMNKKYAGLFMEDAKK